MIYLFLTIILLIGFIIWRERQNIKERQDLILHIKSKTSAEFVEAKKELKDDVDEEPEEPEEIPVGDMENVKFQELINK